MEPTISVKETGNVPAGNKIAVIGLPGVGLAGSIAAFYMARTLGLTEVAQVESEAFPMLIVHEAKPKSPMRFYAGNEILVLVSEIPLEMPLFSKASSAIVNWLKEKTASAIVVLGGLASEKRLEIEKPNVYALSADASLDPLIKKNNIASFEEGAIIGPNAAIIKECMKNKIPCLYLIADAYHRYPDPGAAAALAETLNAAYGMKIDTKELVEKAEEIRIATRDLMKKTDESLGKNTEEIPIMYR